MSDPNNLSHPLFNHLVLEKILSEMNLDDLKSFRQVCSFWNTMALPHLVRKVELHFEGARLEQFLLVCSNQLRSDNNGSSQLPPFDTYTIKICSFLSYSEDVRSMWDIINVSMNQLTLHITTRYANNELKWLLLHNFPSLKKVKLVITKYWGELTQVSQVRTDLQNGNELNIVPNPGLEFFQLSNLGSISLYGINDDLEDFSLPMEWTTFFARFPKIQHLSVIGLNTSDISRMIEVFKIIDQDGIDPPEKIIPKSLEILDENIFPETPSADHLNDLSTLCHHSFGSLHLEIGPTITDPILDRLLENNSRTLESLRLRRYPHPYMTTPLTLTGVNMNHVTFLEVSDAMIPSLSFLSHFPSLEILYIILRDYQRLPYCEIVQNTPNPSRLVHVKLKSLYVEPPLPSRECILKLAICFPNLESLRVRADDEVLEEICHQGQGETGWSNSLRCLYITSWDGLTDEGITGINQQVLKLMGSYSSYQTKQCRTKPYIGNIIGLRSLTIEMWPDYENRMSDWSVYYGILDLDELEDITLIRSGVSLTAFSAIPVPAIRKKLIE